MKQLLSIILFLTFLVGCEKKTPSPDPIPKYSTFKIDSKKVEETRVINIWTPPNYESRKDSFPVIYMPDGGIKEDFPHIANTIAKLVENKSVPPIILVGIENTVRGRDLTGASSVKEHEQYKIPMTDGAKDFRAFITDELMPMIDTNYRTTDTKGIIGESLAGLFVVETFFLKPASFNFYIAMDPSLWWNDNHLVKNADLYLKNLPERQTKIWFAGSGATDINKYTLKLEETLKKNNLNNLILKYSDEPNEKHNTIFRATKEKALIWSLNNL